MLGKCSAPIGRYSREAVDISMSEDTPVLAARAGIVIESISQYVDGAKDLAPRLVRIVRREW